MKNALSLIVLSTVVLTACIEESSDSPQQLTPTNTVDNPLAVVPPDDQTQPQTQPQALPDQEIGFQPIDPSQSVSGVTLSQLSNGPNASSESSTWQCSVDGEVLFSVSFYDDSTGFLSSSEGTDFSTWSIFGNTVSVTDSSGDTVDFSAFQFSGTDSFSSVLRFEDGRSGSIDCVRVSGGGNPAPAPVGQQPDPVNGGQQSSLVNAVINDELQNFWICDVSTGDEVRLAFFDDFSGILISPTYVDGIVLQWQTTSAGVVVTLSDGNQFSFSTPVFSGADRFTANDLLIDGSSGNSASCDRVFL